jgi:hypothetical protein
MSSFLWWLLVLFAVAACGRRGFERIADAPDPPDAGIDERLVAWLPMETDPATRVSPDVTGRGNDASCVDPSCPTRVDGILGQAIALDGSDDRFVIRDAPLLHLTEGFTVSLWVQWFGGDAAVISKPQAMGTGASFEISVLPDRVLACTDDTLGAAGELCLNRLGPIPMDTWVALALTWDGRLRTLYVDGQEVASGEHGSEFDDSPLLIGSDNHDGAPSLHHRGLIDEVQIYDRSLPRAEIAARYAEVSAQQAAARKPGRHQPNAMSTRR